MTDRIAFIENVRSRLDGNKKPPVAIPSDWMPTIEDPVARFGEELAAVGGHMHLATAADTGKTLEGILESYQQPQVVVTREVGVPASVPEAVANAGGELLWWPEAGRSKTSKALVGISSPQWAVAETGTILVSAAPPGGRAPTLLTRVHIAFLPIDRLVPTVADLFQRIAAMPTRPSNLVLATGPSKTADIENVLVRGVHGPEDVHVILVR
jgi:L-lactate dehydrogenase complex protein LldG